MTDFTGRLVIVTGGADGMGEATVHTFARAGAVVVIADRDAGRSDLVEAEVREAGGDAHAIVTDVREPEQVEALVAQVRARWGRIDVLDNNAAALELTADDPGILGLEPGVVMETLRGNVFAPYLMTRAVLPVMLEQGHGAVVNIASVSGMAGELGLTAYGISKAAVIQLTRAVATQYGRDGIRCNAVAPAYVTTRNNAAHAPPELVQIYARSTPAPQVAAPQDIASAVLFLASAEARMINGHVLPVDGGFVAASSIVADFRTVRDGGPVPGEGWRGDS
jgi:NAD(P)-dependent dehydrogenase (short-subunit alcohol dehydrogenase family)